LTSWPYFLYAEIFGIPSRKIKVTNNPSGGNNGSENPHQEVRAGGKSLGIDGFFSI
jgi:hypothetical protein